MMNRDINIRKLEESDRGEFLAMSREFYDSGAVLHSIGEECHLRAFEELMRSEVYLECCIIEYKGETAGYGLLNKSFSREAGGRVVWAEELYIRPEFQGRGLGSCFFSWLEKNVPAARYRLEAEPGNAGAIRLYGRLGYKRLPYIQMVKDSDRADGGAPEQG